MTRPPWLVRRCLVAPLMPVLAVVALALLPLVVLGHAVVAAVVALRGRPVRWRLPRAWLFGIAYLGLETVCLVVALALWLQCGGRVRGAAAQRRHVAVLRRFLRVLVGLAGVTFRFRLQVHDPVSRPGDTGRLSGETPVLVLARHAGPGASFVLVHLLIERYSRVPRVVLTERLRWDPAIDVMLSRLGSRFISRGGDEATAAIGGLAGELEPHDALVIYPEGGDWTPTRHRRAVSRLRRKGLREQADLAAAMPRVLPPRPAGVTAALAGAPQADVVVVTHTGHDELLDLETLWAALPLRRELDVLWWREPRPARVDEEGVGDWLFEVWQDIDRWVAEQQELDRLTGRALSDRA